MFDKLKETVKHFDDIAESLSDPAVINDNEQYTRLMKEYRGLEPIVEKYKEYEKALSDEADALAMTEESDPEMKENTPHPQGPQ